jgi:hypothetical protein
MSAVIPATPTTAQLLGAFAQALLPFAGPIGVAASAVIPAAEQFLANLKATGNGTVFTMADLEAIAAKTTTDLGQLGTDVGQAP